jgi:hypothetical protein
MAETKTQPAQVADAPAAAGGVTATATGTSTAADREYRTVAVVEVTLARSLEADANHQDAADSAAAELAQGTGDGWQETGRRVKSVQVRQV